MKYGYARVSSVGQKLDVQLEILHKAGCRQIYQEKISGKSRARPQLKKLLAVIAAGDEIVVTKLDRLVRSGLDFHNIRQELIQKGVAFTCTEQPMLNFDPNKRPGPMEKLTADIIAAVAEMEGALIVQRTQEGREYARRNGVQFGRKQKLNPAQRRQVFKWAEEGKTQKEIAHLLGVHRHTVRAVLKTENN
jgi:DNA invertase Pin-like site-specific DNA recombinase